MIITIQGKRGEGKTAVANKICEGKKSVCIAEYSLASAFWTEEIDVDTEIILIDDVRNYDKTCKYFRSEFLTINKQCKKPVNINMPDVILIKYPNFADYII
jgi:hypothetical protein